MEDVGNDASGNKLKGYPCCVNKVKAGEVEIQDFYFYASPTAQNALLGFDFIDACRTSKLVRGNVAAIFNQNNYAPDCVSKYLNGYNRICNLEEELSLLSSDYESTDSNNANDNMLGTGIKTMDLFGDR